MAWKVTITYKDGADLTAEQILETPTVNCKNGPQGTITVDGEADTFIVPADRLVSIMMVKQVE